MMKTTPGAVSGTSKQEIPGYNGAMDVETEKPAKPHRRGLRFSLRTLLIVVMVLSVLLGWRQQHVRRERATIAWVEEMGGFVSYQSWFSARMGQATLNNSSVSDLSPLAELKSLKLLGLGYTKVSDLSPLAELKSLEWLNLDYTQVSDLSPLAELRNLERLGLRGTQVSDLSPLAELKSLESLSLDYTQVSDLSPLAELRNLESLRLKGTQVSDEQVQELRQVLPLCEIITE